MLELGIKIDEWYLLNVFSPFCFTLVCFTFTLGLTPELSVWTVESHIKRRAVGNVQGIQLHGTVAVAKSCCFSVRSNDHHQVPPYT